MFSILNKSKLFIENNLIFWLFFSSIFLFYINVNRTYYILYAITFIVMLFNIQNLIKDNRIKFVCDKKILILVVSFLLYTIIISLLHYQNVNIKSIIKMGSIYVIFIFILLKINIDGEKYVINFYRYFTLILNIFTVINLKEILSKKSLYYNFILEDMGWIFTGGNFRVYSIFMHPIIYGTFLVILFWSNTFIIKNKYIKFILQIIVVINLFLTKSRSAWVAFIITLLIWYLRFIIYKFKKYGFKITYKRVYEICLIVFLMAVSIIIFRNYISDFTTHISNEIYEKVITITNDDYGDISRLQRLGTIEAINTYMISNGPTNFLFGNGVGTVGDFMADNVIVLQNFTTTDNQYSTFFYEFGFIGILLYMSIVVFSIIKFLKNDIFHIQNISILCFLVMSISIFFFEFGTKWMDAFVFLIIVMSFMCIKNDI